VDTVQDGVNGFHIGRAFNINCMALQSTQECHKRACHKTFHGRVLQESGRKHYWDCKSIVALQVKMVTKMHPRHQPL